MALIITDKGPEVAKSILQGMKRGVTGLPGKGMYTGSEHTVLLCALTVTEVQHLKALVNAEDPNAFVIVTPAKEHLEEFKKLSARAMTHPGKQSFSKKNLDEVSSYLEAYRKGGK